MHDRVVTTIDGVVVASGGVRLRVRCWPGEDTLTPFLLVHGLASNSLLWSEVASGLARKGHRVVTVDQRGHGRSDKPDDGYDFATVTADLRAVVEGCGIPRPVAVGQSWGGNVVLELAWRWPELVAGIGCVDGGWIELARRFPDWAGCAEALSPPPLGGLGQAEIERRLRAMHATWPEPGIRATLANFEHRSDGTVSPWLTRDRHLQILRALWEHRPSQRYHEVRSPVLLVPATDRAANERSRDGAPVSGEQWHHDVDDEVAVAEGSLPLSRTRRMTGDHDLHAQQPDELVAVLLDAVNDGFFG